MIWSSGHLAVVAAAGFCWFGSSCTADAAEKHSLPEFLLRSWNDDDGLPSSPVRAIAHTPDGYLWIGTDRGLARFDGVRYVTFTTNELNALTDNRITALLVDAAGELWVGTQNGSLCRRSAGAFVGVPSQH